MDFKVDGSAGRGRPRKSWLECVNDNMRKFGKRDGTAVHDRTVWRSAIHGTSELCKHGKCDVKWIDR